MPVPRRHVLVVVADDGRQIPVPHLVDLHVGLGVLRFKVVHVPSLEVRKTRMHILELLK